MKTPQTHYFVDAGVGVKEYRNESYPSRTSNSESRTGDRVIRVSSIACCERSAQLEAQSVIRRTKQGFYRTGIATKSQRTNGRTGDISARQPKDDGSLAVSGHGCQAGQSLETHRHSDYQGTSEARPGDSPERAYEGKVFSNT